MSEKKKMTKEESKLSAQKVKSAQEKVATSKKTKAPAKNQETLKEAKLKMAATEKPAKAAKPAPAEKPDKAAKPAPAEKPAKTAKPASVEKPAKIPQPVLPKSQFGVTLSMPPASMELPVAREAFRLRVKSWMKDLEKEGHLKPDNALFIPKELYFSTGLGDFNKVATWAQWYGVQLISDLANIDRQRFALVAIEQVTDVTTFIYGLLQRETGQIRHQFNLVVEEMPAKMAAQGIDLPSWFDVKDLDHYRLG